ncbi:hypothetical protein ACQEV2_43235 [Streptomyces sp. CA-251387]|uniref:hypothetical protein n=1 Tax=Streptomyces sp. CA-251387 TaxID=3240064 RepID=UPI003D8FF860
MNALYWLDNNGYPNLVPAYNPSSSGNQVDYQGVTSLISDLAGRMDTGDWPYDGTTVSGAVDGLNDYFADHGYGQALRAEYEDFQDVRNPSYRLAELGSAGRGRNLILLRLWTWKDSALGLPEHTSGHIVTLTESVGTGWYTHGPHPEDHHMVRIHDSYRYLNTEVNPDEIQRDGNIDSQSRSHTAAYGLAPARRADGLSLFPDRGGVELAGFSSDPTRSVVIEGAYVIKRL